MSQPDSPPATIHSDSPKHSSANQKPISIHHQKPPKSNPNSNNNHLTTYCFNRFKWKRRIAVENANSPWTFTIFTTTDWIWVETVRVLVHRVRVQKPDWTKHHKRHKQKRESRWNASGIKHAPPPLAVRFLGCSAGDTNSLDGYHFRRRNCY